jgi:hypothetical protein
MLVSGSLPPQVGIKVKAESKATSPALIPVASSAPIPLTFTVLAALLSAPSPSRRYVLQGLGASCVLRGSTPDLWRDATLPDADPPGAMS